MKKHSDMKQDMPAMRRVAKAEVMKHEAKMHKGKKMADGGYVGCGKRSMQDYGKGK